jgi:4-hydroxyphenylpyruvate dioxygenase
MATLGIKGLTFVEFYVRDLPRAQKLLTQALDFAEVAASGAEYEGRTGSRSLLFEAGRCHIMVSTPVGKGNAQRFLDRHPEGVGMVYFEVKEIEGCLVEFELRGGTPTTGVESFEGEEGVFKQFVATTPFGDARFCFYQRDNFEALVPGLERYAAPKGGTNRFGFEWFDHMTSNFMSLSPAILWMQHVMGMEHYWNIEFHTQDVSVKTGHVGSGLKSIVMREPESGAKFANNEPLRPHFDNSQITIFCNDNRGAGIQHLAITVPDIEACVRGLRAAGAEFLGTPGTYYDAMPARLKEVGIEHIDEDPAMLRELGILVDGEGPGRYLLQIFLKELAGLHHDSEAGPFFFEIIQRKGAKGFGGGNFRALFESIERDQLARVEG